jgi:hypothetical protein
VPVNAVVCTPSQAQTVSPKSRHTEDPIPDVPDNGYSE